MLLYQYIIIYGVQQIPYKINKILIRGCEGQLFIWFSINSQPNNILFTNHYLKSTASNMFYNLKWNLAISSFSFLSS